MRARCVSHSLCAGEGGSRNSTFFCRAGGGSENKKCPCAKRGPNANKTNLCEEESECAGGGRGLALFFRDTPAPREQESNNSNVNTILRPDLQDL